jgi:membrane-associated protease RseP (regulator of RpoE activity)
VALEIGDSTTRTGTATAHEPETGLVLLRLDAPVEVGASTRLATEPAAPGELAVVAARFDRRAFVAPVFIATASAERYGLTAGGGAVRPGLPVFNVNGQALALAAGRADPRAAFAVGPALARLRERLRSGPALPRSIGVRLQPLSPELERHLGGPGALVTEVTSGAPAERAGLRPGDVIVRVGTEPVGDLDAALRAIARAGAAAQIELRRAGATRELAVAPELALTSPSPPAARVPPPAPEAGAVFEAPALEAAQLPRTARVLAVDGRNAANGKAATALLRSRRPPWLVYVQDETGRYFALVGRAPRDRP